MWVEILKPVVAAKRPHKQGEELNLNDKEARQLILSGKAKLIAPPQPTPPVKKSTRLRKTKY